jgi:hypothetical protein
MGLEAALHCLRGEKEVRKARVMYCSSLGRVTPRHERIAFESPRRDHLYTCEPHSLWRRVKLEMTFRVMSYNDCHARSRD